MKKVIRLTENELSNLIKELISEQAADQYIQAQSTSPTGPSVPKCSERLVYKGGIGASGVLQGPFEKFEKEFNSKITFAYKGGKPFCYFN